MAVSVTITGSQRVMNRLRRLAADSPQVVDKVLTTWSRETTAALKGKKYPPPRPGQKYKRTGRLANSWRVERRKAGQVAIVNNARSPRGQVYPGYVVGDSRGEGQAFMHKGRWWRARDVIDAEAKRLPAELTKALLAHKA